MRRREFLLMTAGAAAVPAAAAGPATVLYDDRAVDLSGTRSDSNNDLWVRAADLPRVNGFELKPQGACRADVCIPVPGNLKSSDLFNLTGFAHRIHQAYVADADVWSFGEIPQARADFYQSRIAPDFAVPDRRGRIVHLSDFRGKKVLVLTWASW